MGLDMYLYNGKKEVGYWRKANSIHGWMVKNIQGGVDDCGKYEISFDKLLELRDLCRSVIELKQPELLPPTEGFFFGSTNVDGYYYADLEETINIINRLDKKSKRKFYYESSW